MAIWALLHINLRLHSSNLHSTVNCQLHLPCNKVAQYLVWRHVACGSLSFCFGYTIQSMTHSTVYSAAVRIQSGANQPWWHFSGLFNRDAFGNALRLAWRMQRDSARLYSTHSLTSMHSLCSYNVRVQCTRRNCRIANNQWASLSTELHAAILRRVAQRWKFSYLSDFMPRFLRRIFHVVNTDSHNSVQVTLFD